jgi:hypothetical protein
MGIHVGHWRVGVIGLEGTVKQGSSGVTVLAMDSDSHVVLCKAALGDIPSGKAGYAIGCLLMNTTDGKLYSNSSATSCSFVKVSTA